MTRGNPRVGRIRKPVNLVDDLFANLWDLYVDRFVEVHEGVMEHEQIGITIPAAMFRKLIALCHPDKHGNSQTSQEVTRWLIEQREKQRATQRQSE